MKTKKEYMKLKNIKKKDMSSIGNCMGQLVRKFKDCWIIYQEFNAGAFVVIPTSDHLTIVCGSIEEALIEKETLMKLRKLTKEVDEIEKELEKENRRINKEIKDLMRK